MVLPLYLGEGEAPNKRLIPRQCRVQARKQRVVGAHPIRFLDVSSCCAAFKRGASQLGGKACRAHQKGVIFRGHRPLFFGPFNRLGNRLGGCIYLSGGTPLDQREFPFLQRVEGPRVVPQQWVRIPKTYRQAVKLAWDKRRVENLTKAQLATHTGLPAQHISDYFAADDRPTRRDLPGKGLPKFEEFVENTLVSQWLAAQSKLTVLEEIQATNQRRAA